MWSRSSAARAHAAVWSVAAGLACAACVEGAAKSPVGASRFSSASPHELADYAAEPIGGVQSGSGGAAAGPASAGKGGAAATAGFVPPTAMQAGTGATGSSGQGGSGAMGAAGAGAGRGAAGSGTAGGAAGSAATGPASAGTLTIAFTSVDQSGRYAPRNVGAVWIETSGGMFVKTIERWAGIRANHLTRWAQSSGGWGGFFGGGNTVDRMDAISRATLARHEKHELMWDLHDLQGQIVPDGKYKVFIEVTEDNRIPGANASVEFDKGAAPQMLMPADQEPWSGLVVTYQP